MLACQPPDGPEVTVSASGTDPGEHLLNVIAMRLLAARAAYPPHIPLDVAGLTVGLVAEGLGDVVDGPAGLRGPPAGQPGPAISPRCATTWRSAATGSPRRPPTACPSPGAACSSRLRQEADAAAGPIGSAGGRYLPECDGIRFTVLGVHGTADRTVIFMHASGVTGDESAEMDRWPAIWVCDSAGGWHATSATGSTDRTATSPWAYR